MTDLDAAGDGRIGDELAVASPPDRFGAHHRGGSVAGPLHQVVERVFERRRLHVIGVAAESLDPPRGVHRITPRLAKAAKLCHMAIRDSGVGKRRCEDLTAEMRVPARTRHRAYIGKLHDLVRSQKLQKFGERSDRVTDGPYRHVSIIAAAKRFFTSSGRVAARLPLPARNWPS